MTTRSGRHASCVARRRTWRAPATSTARASRSPRRQAAALEGDDEGAAPAFLHALALLRAGGVAPRFVGQVVRAYARLEAGRGDVTAALAQVERTLDDLAAAGEGTDVAPAPRAAELVERDAAADARERRDLDDTRARLLATAGDLDAAATLAESVAEEFARAGDVRDAAHAFWLSGRSRCAAGKERTRWSCSSRPWRASRSSTTRSRAPWSATRWSRRCAGRDDEAAAVGTGLSG